MQQEFGQLSHEKVSSHVISIQFKLPRNKFKVPELLEHKSKCKTTRNKKGIILASILSTSLPFFLLAADPLWRGALVRTYQHLAPVQRSPGLLGLSRARPASPVLELLPRVQDFDSREP